MGRISGSGAHLIVAKNDIHAPMQTVLHAPVLAYRLIPDYEKAYEVAWEMLRSNRA